MMKTTCTILSMALLFFFTTDLRAQYNKTWYDGESVDLIDAGNGHSVVVGKSTSYDILLKQLDFNGNVVFDKGFNIVQGNPGEDAIPHKVIQTLAGDYIVVGIYSTYDAVTRAYDFSPFAVRFDAMGQVMWVKVYQSSISPSPKPNIGGYSRVNIVYVENDPGVESYILTSPSDPHTPMLSSVYSDIVINALRIDEHGTPLWNRKYRLDDFSRNNVAPYTSYFAYECYPQALAFVPNSGESLGVYFIGGIHVRWYFGGYDEVGFYMGIDKDGNITNSFSRIHEYIFSPFSTPPLYMFWNDALYDTATQEVVMASSTPNWHGGGSSASAITVTRFDNALNLIGGKHYIYPDATENYAFGIQEDATGNHYIIAAYIHDVPLNTSSMTLLQLDKVSMSPTFYNRYNPTRDVVNAAIASVTDPGTMVENYVMAGTVVGVPRGQRVISTDVMGNACGVDPLPVLEGSWSLTTQLDPFEELVVYNDFDPGYTNQDVYPTETDCDIDPNYKTQLLSEVVEEAPAVLAYPTILHESEDAINLELDVAGETTLQLTLHAMDGRLVREQTLPLTPGRNRLLWNSGIQQSGMYLLKLTAQDGTVSETVRLVKQ